MCTFILLLLSGERDFTVTLNKPITGAKLPTEFPRPAIPYTHFDFLALLVTRLITDAPVPTPPHQAPVLECILTVLANCSPFIKSIGMFPAVSLVRLFEYLCHPRVLFSGENICRLVHILLEIFNNVIMYQYEGMHYLYLLLMLILFR